MTVAYHINQVPAAPDLFKVVKFLDGEEQPADIYFVKLVKRGERGYVKGHTDPQMHCDCPNRRRGKHVNDKHGVMVAKWLLAGKPVGYFDTQGDFHGAAEIIDHGLTIDEPANDSADDAGSGYDPD